MPMIDVRCPTCEAEYEIFRHTVEVEDVPLCEKGCGPCERIYKYQRPHSYEGLRESVVVYRNPDGSYGIPGTRDARIPEGSERIELRTAADVRRVERHMTNTEYSKFVAKQESEERTMGALQAERRAQLRDMAKNFSQKGKDFAQLAMKMNDAAPRKKFQTNVMFDAFSNNAGNRDTYRGDDHRQGRK
jgi:hypothetical protein